jgi:hypothetical protein
MEVMVEVASVVEESEEYFEQIVEDSSEEWSDDEDETSESADVE